MSFWGELKRRNVYKVGVAYAIVAWLLIQFAAIAFPHLDFPSWAVPFVIIILIIGFPVVLIIAWAFEVTPEGIKRTKEVPLAESITRLTGQKLNYIVTGLLVLAVGLLVVKVFFLNTDVEKAEVSSTGTPQIPAVSEAVKTKKTIAVLPFENLSSDPEQVYFVDGLSEEILNSLAQISDLNVIGRTSSFSFKGSNKTVQEIASVLGADHVLEGSVRKAGDALRITAQLLRGTDGVHLWSKTYDRELKDIFEVQEDIATTVADELKVTLGIGKSLKQLGGTENVEAYEQYLIALSQDNDQKYNSALESIDKAIELRTEFALAWALKSNIHWHLAIFGPSNLAASQQETGLNAALKAIEFEPNLVDSYISLCLIKASKGDFLGAGLANLKALELRSGPISAKDFSIGDHYCTVGYLKRANEIFEEIKRNDPFNHLARAEYMLNLGFLGQKQRAEEEYERGMALFGDQWSWGKMFITAFRIGLKDIVSIDDIVWSDPIFDAAKEHLESPKDGLVELRRIYNYRNNLSGADFANISICATYFGDLDFAMDAMEKSVSIEASSIWWIWLPVMHEIRQTPRCKALVKKIGLVDYWNEFGWPDLCHQLDNGDFECD